MDLTKRITVWGTEYTPLLDDFIATYTKGVLTEPDQWHKAEQTEKEAIRELERIVKAFSPNSRDSAKHAIVLTVITYLSHRIERAPVKDMSSSEYYKLIQSKFQGYLDLAKEAFETRKVPEGKAKIRNEFVNFLEFFAYVDTAVDHRKHGRPY